MKKLTQEELDNIVAKHELWLKDDIYGKKANLSNLDLSGLALTNANLTNANLSYVNLTNANLTNANLTAANLIEVDLTNVNLTNANLYRVSLYEANIANITGKEIVTFKAGKHFAYYVDGYIKIGCKCLPIKEWKDNYKIIGKDNGYNDKDIELYGDFIEMISKRFSKKYIN